MKVKRMENVKETGRMKKERIQSALLQLLKVKVSELIKASLKRLRGLIGCMWN